MPTHSSTQCTMAPCQRETQRQQYGLALRKHTQQSKHNTKPAHGTRSSNTEQDQPAVAHKPQQGNRRCPQPRHRDPAASNCSQPPSQSADGEPGPRDVPPGQRQMPSKQRGTCQVADTPTDRERTERQRGQPNPNADIRHNPTATTMSTRGQAHTSRRRPHIAVMVAPSATLGHCHKRPQHGNNNKTSPTAETVTRLAPATSSISKSHNEQPHARQSPQTQMAGPTQNITSPSEKEPSCEALHDHIAAQ